MRTIQYEIDSELAKLTRQKAPSNPYIYPIVNLAIQLSGCTARASDGTVAVKKYTVPGYAGATLSAFIIEPKQSSGVLPCIVFYHGGGLLLKASKTHYQIAKWYAKTANCRVVFPDYRLLPANRYPVPAEDCYCAYRWVLRRADSLGIDPHRILVAGDSAGGYLAAAATLMLWDRDRISPSGAMLIYPVTDRRMITASMQKFTDTPVWDASLTKMFWKTYLRGRTQEPVPYASPMEAPSLGHFPKVYMEVAEFDCLRDEGVSFAERLRAEGVSTVLYEVKRACHGYETALESRIVNEALQRRSVWIRSVFDLH